MWVWISWRTLLLSEGKKAELYEWRQTGWSKVWAADSTSLVLEGMKTAGSLDTNYTRWSRLGKTHIVMRSAAEWALVWWQWDENSFSQAHSPSLSFSQSLSTAKSSHHSSLLSTRCLIFLLLIVYLLQLLFFFPFSSVLEVISLASSYLIFKPALQPLPSLQWEPGEHQHCAKCKVLAEPGAAVHFPQQCPAARPAGRTTSG